MPKTLYNKPNIHLHSFFLNGAPWALSSLTVFSSFLTVPISASIYFDCCTIKILCFSTSSECSRAFLKALF